MNYHMFPRIQAGDIGFSKGNGLSGFLIRLGTRSAYGHCWVYDHVLSCDADGNETWATVEAWPSKGVALCERSDNPIKVVRVCRNSVEQSDLLNASRNFIGCRYGWGEIVRIFFRFLNIKFNRWPDNINSVICSNHVAQSVALGRPDFDLYLRYPYNEIWPGELAITLDAFIWDTELA